jgi:hypothetical protein
MIQDWQLAIGAFVLAGFIAWIVWPVQAEELPEEPMT